MTLSAPTGASATILDGLGVGTIVNDDAVAAGSEAQITSNLTGSNPADSGVPLTKAGPGQLVLGALNSTTAGNSFTNPLFINERRGLDHVINRATPLPSALTRPLGNAVTALLEAARDRPSRTESSYEPQRIAAGSLGHWGDNADEATA